MPNLIERHRETVRQLLDGGMSQVEIAKQLQVSRRTVHRIVEAMGRIGTKANTVEDMASIEEDGDNLQYRATTRKPIKTLKELEVSCEVDFAVWRVKKWSCKGWTTAMKVKADGKENPEVVQNYSVSADFERILPRSLQEATDAIFLRMAKYAPKYAGMPKPKKGGEFLALLSLADHHFGKLCWSPEAGTNYDLKIAEVLFRDAVDDLIAECAGKSVERWLFPLGNDLVHIDNSRNKTFNETPQDVDGRYAKIIETAEMSVIRAVERMAETAPVSVLWIPGNHDRTTSFHVARTVQAWFRNCPRVTVDVGPNPRKYFQWHRTLLGFTHGDQEKIATLPNIMASERPKEWAASDCRHWFLGHMHRSRKWLTQGGDAFEGTEIKVMRSLGGTDRWHHDNGYIGGEKSRAAEVHWYGKTRGYSGHAIVNARAA